MKRDFSLLFILLGLIALVIGVLFGLLISMVYIFPGFFKDIVPFNQLRPMHTSFVISWIILTAIGGIYYYIQHEEKLQLFSRELAKWHFAIYFAVALIIPFSLLTNKMGGREYLEFTPVLILPILMGWVFFGINYYKTLFKSVKNWPAYYWMWGIGIAFMIFHLSESNFWMFDSFRKDFIKDISVQWKSYGSFVGSWNMLVYGTALYLMSKIKDDVKIARGRTTFFFMFLGLTNLMFGWAHHTYIIPTQPWIRYVAYAISMTEWIIFIKIVWSWRKSLSKSDKTTNSMAYRFILASDFWVFVNLVMALFMSIPSVNYYTHGTHITVAHSMGTTIGINTMILFASVSFILSRSKANCKNNQVFQKFSFYFLNGSLFIFWLMLIVLGLLKIDAGNAAAGSASLLESQAIYYIVFVFTGLLLFISILLIAIPMIYRLEPICTTLLYPKTIQDEIDFIEEAEN